MSSSMSIILSSYFTLTSFSLMTRTIYDVYKNGLCNTQQFTYDDSTIKIVIPTNSIIASSIQILSSPVTEPIIWYGLISGKEQISK